ncbi:MAG TPA: hypothetical protein VFS57_02530, partial [Gemmatimonadaceae bacterium]|nr:hypothetical protein [Gemmatimonadaceae bacterium]
MHFRLSAVLVVAAGTLVATAATAYAQVSSTTIEYRSGSGGTGYDSASFTARYALRACDGWLVITTEFVRGSFRWSDTYWLDGTSYPAPAGLSPTVNDQGEFDGTVRVRGGAFVGSFRSTAGGQSAHECIGDTARVADLSRFVNVKDRPAVDRFIGSLEVIPDTNPVHRNANVESAIRDKLAEEQREAARKADDERKRKEDEERKRKEEQEHKANEDAEAAKRTQDEAANAQDDAARDAAARKAADAEAARKAA